MNKKYLIGIGITVFVLFFLGVGMLIGSVDEGVDKTNTGKDRIRNVEIVGYTAYVDLNMDDNLFGIESIKRSAINKNVEIFIETFNNPKSSQIEVVIIRNYFPLVDKYGQESDSIVMTLNLRRETYQKINFDNLYGDEVLFAIDSYFLHPALS